MRLLNATRLRASCVMSVDADGRERAVVVAKGTFELPMAGDVAPLAEDQLPLVDADTFTAEPGRSAVIHECDFAPFKPRCDVLFVGAAHAPQGQPQTELPVALRVGSWSKHFEVIGPRYWTMGALGLRPSRPKPFTALPISYDVAFGGTETDAKGREHAYRPNPVGRGWASKMRDRDLLGQPLPSTQAIGELVSSPRKAYRPMALGPIGRQFTGRLEHAGTYDEAWLRDRFPLLPTDFDPRYFQAAPPDQQIPYPSGGELVQLLNLSPSPVAPFRLPSLPLPICFVLADGSTRTQSPVLDTLILEPEQDRLQLVWRTSLPLRDGPGDLREVGVGPMSPAWHRARETGKLYFRSLAELVEADLPWP